MAQAQKIIRAKLGLLELAKRLGNVSQACKLMGYSRDSFYRFKELYEKGGELALPEISRRKPVLKNRTPVEIAEAVVVPAVEQPAWGQVRVSNELRARPVDLAGGGALRLAAARSDHAAAPPEGARSQGGTGGGHPHRGAAHRLGEGPGRQGGARRVREGMPRLLWGAGHLLCRHAQGCRSHLSADRHDTYAKVAFAKLYDRKAPITAADLLNDRVVPFCDEHEIRLCRVLTDRGTEYCGSPERHEYELYLAVEDIDHSRTKTKSPQTNGICERFYRTVLDEFDVLPDFHPIVARVPG
jgi:hypothetical protein